jgi:Protein of unknown function (DUF3662)/FHA domain
MLRHFEQRLERLVEGAFTKAFRSGLQPVEVGRRLVREADRTRTLGVRATIVPNVYTVEISPDDHERFVAFGEALVNDLADMLRAHAREERYQFVGPVEIVLVPTERLKPGDLRVKATMHEDLAGVPASLVLSDGTRVRLGSEPLVIGRLEDCPITVADPKVSRHHAELRREREGIRIVDLGSTNGTFVNGHAVRDAYLDDGDRIDIGPAILVFEAS